MKNLFIATIRTIIITTCLIAFSPARGQQHVIADKDNPRPELKANTTEPAFITYLNARKWSGYHEIKWTASRQYDTRKYIVEYSVDGINYQTASEKMVDNNLDYSIKHHILDDRPMLYRIRSEQLNGKFFYTENILLDGIPVSPVKLYPTIITGNTVNIISSWPLERINVYASNGAQVFSKDIGGQKDYMAIVVPNLARGMYWMAFYGDGWKTTEKFVIQ